MKKVFLSLFVSVLGALALLSLAGTAFAGGGVDERHTNVTFGNSTENRLYYVYQPAVCAEKACPLVIMYHGLNIFPNTVEAAWLTANGYGWQATADANEFVVAFPSATTMAPRSFFGYQYDPPAAMGGSNPSQRWDMQAIDFSAVMNPTGHTPKATKDTKFTEVLISEMIADYNVLPSHGAFFSSYVGMYLSNAIEAFASHSGGRAEVYGVSWPAYPTNAVLNPGLKTEGLIIYSGNDSIVSSVWSSNLANAMNSRGHYAELDEIVPGINHNWDPSSNQRQWDFFMEHSPDLPEEPVEEPAYVSFAVSDGTGAESLGETDIVVKVEGNWAGNNVVLGLDVSGSAVMGEDFGLPGGMTIDVGASESAIVKLHVFSDDELEGDETVVLSLNVLEGNAVRVEPIEYIYTIIDDTELPVEPVSVSFPVTDGSAFENQWGTYVDVYLDDASDEQVKVLVYVDDSVSTADEGVDFELTGTVMTFQPGEIKKDVGIEVFSDWVDEGDETVALKLEIIEGNAVLGKDSTFVLTIIDTTIFPLVEFANDEGGGTEDGKGATAKIYVNRDGKGCGVVDSVEVSVIGGTATEGVDFEIIGNVLDFGIGEFEKYITLNILSGEDVEEDETVVLGLEIAGGCAILGGQDEYVFNIYDDDVEEPPEEEHVWEVEKLAVLNNYSGVVWQYDNEPTWGLTYDYGFGKPKYSAFFSGPYDGYKILDVEASWKSPYYWWAMWMKPDGTFGLFGRASNQNPLTDKVVYLGLGEDEVALDMAVDKAGYLNILAISEVDLSAVIYKYQPGGAFVGSYAVAAPSYDGTWVPVQMFVDLNKKPRIVWMDTETLEDYVVQKVNNLKWKLYQYSPVFSGPDGWALADAEPGWKSNDQSSRLLFADGEGGSKIWKVDMNGDVEAEFDFDGDAEEMETALDNSIHLMIWIGDASVVEVWKIDPSTGAVKAVKEFSAE